MNTSDVLDLPEQLSLSLSLPLPLSLSLSLQSGFTAHLDPKLTGRSPQSLYNPYMAWHVCVEPSVHKFPSCESYLNSSERQLSVCSSLMISADMQKSDIMLRYSLHDVSVFYKGLDIVLQFQRLAETAAGASLWL